MDCVLDNTLLQQLSVDFDVPAEDERFRPTVNQESINRIQELTKPDNTRKKEKWAISLFERWCVCRGENVDVLGIDESKIDDLFTRFCMEVRKENGQEYPAKTLYEIVCSLQSHMRARGRNLNLFDKSSSSFNSLRKTLDGLMRERNSKGIGLGSK